MKILIPTVDQKSSFPARIKKSQSMRPQALTRLIRVNRRIPLPFLFLIIASCIRLIRHNTTSSSSRLNPREADSVASENFIEKSTSQSAAQLLQQPERDVHTYDTKPPVRFTTQSISALHARIGLPVSFPLETLERCLTDPSTVEDHNLHNEALSVVGAGLLEYYVTEYLCVRWPRLAMKTQGAALWGYTGESALARIAREWGVQSQSSEERKRKVKGRERRVDMEIEAPKLVVKPPGKEGSTEAKWLGKNMEWEVREQMRMGWVDRTGKSLGEWDDENQYQLFGLQRFVQALVGGVYVHSVPSGIPFPNISFFVYIDMFPFFPLVRAPNSHSFLPLSFHTLYFLLILRTS